MGQQKQAKVIDFAAFRAAHPRASQPLLPFVARAAAPLSLENIAHRQRMLRYLTAAKPSAFESPAAVARLGLPVSRQN